MFQNNIGLMQFIKCRWRPNGSVIVVEENERMQRPCSENIKVMRCRQQEYRGNPQGHIAAKTR
jgi:hypothetical protein